MIDALMHLFILLLGNLMTILTANYGGNSGIMTIEQTEAFLSILSQLFNIPIESFFQLRLFEDGSVGSDLTNWSVSVLRFSF